MSPHHLDQMSQRWQLGSLCNVVKTLIVSGVWQRYQRDKVLFWTAKKGCYSPPWSWLMMEGPGWARYKLSVGGGGGVLREKKEGSEVGRMTIRRGTGGVAAKAGRPRQFISFEFFQIGEKILQLCATIKGRTILHIEFSQHTGLKLDLSYCKELCVGSQ